MHAMKMEVCNAYLRNSYLINQIIEDNCDVFLREDTLKSFSRSIADAVDIEEYSY